MPMGRSLDLECLGCGITLRSAREYCGRCQSVIDRWRKTHEPERYGFRSVPLVLSSHRTIPEDLGEEPEDKPVPVHSYKAKGQ